ncbi:MAG: hypothetical protein K8S14_05385, partial [Actinomycetia bacterium]|nr:hypothetical protein [Actinomycetes bacterium]
KEKENIFEVEIKRKLNNYIRSGGFVEAFNFNEEMQKKYFKEGLLERVIFKDLPGIYDIKYPDLLFRLLKIIANQPGMLLDYKNMANDLKIDHRTLSSYIAYLEYAMLVQKVYNYSTNFLTSEKKLKKIYLSNTAFSISLAYNFDMSLILEQYFVNRFKARFFSRTPQKEEVDIVMESDMNAVPVEIKIRNKIDRSSLKPMLKFLKNVNQKEGYLITKDTEKIYSMDKYIIRAIPYWKYWSIKKIIGA